VFQIWWRSVQGFSIGWGSNFAIPHWLWRSSLQHSHTTVWTCDKLLLCSRNWLHTRKRDPFAKAKCLVIFTSTTVWAYRDWTAIVITMRYNASWWWGCHWPDDRWRTTTWTVRERVTRCCYWLTHSRWSWDQVTEQSDSLTIYCDRKISPGAGNL